MSAPALRVIAALGVAVLLAGVGAGCDSASSPRSSGKTPTASPQPSDVDSCASIKTHVIAAVATLSGLGPHARPPSNSTRLLISARDEAGVARYDSPPAQRAPLQHLFASLSQLRSAASTADPAAVDAAIRSTAVDLAAYGNTCAAVATQKPSLPAGADKIQHVVFVMMSGRSFDHYFASFPGADGAVSGSTSVCVPNPALRACSKPWHDPSTDDRGGPHTLPAGLADIHGGKMDGFVSQRLASLAYCRKPQHAKGVICRREYKHPDVLGYHDQREIPNYWTYASQFVLQDHMFAPNLGSDEATHLAMVSGWSAVCASPSITNSCRPTLGRPPAGNVPAQAPPPYKWTDLTFLLHKQGVSWGYYVAPGSVNACLGTPAQQIHCNPAVPGARPVGTPITWNPLPGFATVHDGGQLGNVQFHPQFFDAASTGRLPAVSWIVPSWADGEQGPATASRGQAWVTKVVNAVMSGPDWAHSAVFVTWDGWGGFYDHVKPPVVDAQGYGIRVPGLMISPYAKRGMIDHQTLSSDAYLKLVEDLFLGGQRLDPYTDGRWDPRRSVREEAAGLGDLLSEFDFGQPPRKPVLLAPTAH
jgi:phospholipase C